MEAHKVTYVVHVIPTSQTLSQTRHFVVDHRNPYLLETPDDVVAVQFYDMYEAETEDGIELSSKEVNVSPLYFIRGKVIHLQDALRDHGVPDAVKTNALRYDVNRLIKFGGFYTRLDDADIYLKDYVSHTNNGRNPKPKTD